MPHDEGMDLLLLSIHGLLRGSRPELGRDPDTGGQILYVLELARALGRDPSVKRVRLVTRLIRDPNVDDDYAVPCVFPAVRTAISARSSCGLIWTSSSTISLPISAPKAGSPIWYTGITPMPGTRRRASRACSTYR